MVRRVAVIPDLVEPVVRSNEVVNGQTSTTEHNCTIFPSEVQTLAQRLPQVAPLLLHLRKTCSAIDMPVDLVVRCPEAGKP
jgi:hypothetical protein